MKKWGFINPNSIKPNESSDHERETYSRLVSHRADAANTGSTFSLMKLAERMICGAPSNREWNLSVQKVMC